MKSSHLRISFQPFRLFQTLNRSWAQVYTSSLSNSSLSRFFFKILLVFFIFISIRRCSLSFSVGSAISASILALRLFVPSCALLLWFPLDLLLLCCVWSRIGDRTRTMVALYFVRANPPPWPWLAHWASPTPLALFFVDSQWFLVFLLSCVCNWIGKRSGRGCLVLCTGKSTVLAYESWLVTAKRPTWLHICRAATVSVDLPLQNSSYGWGLGDILVTYGFTISITALHFVLINLWQFISSLCWLYYCWQFPTLRFLVHWDSLCLLSMVQAEFISHARKQTRQSKFYVFTLYLTFYGIF